MVSPGKIDTELPARLEEDVRLVGALAELFATAAAERLMEAGATREPSPGMFPLLTFATGLALCAPMLEAHAMRRPSRRRVRKSPGSPTEQATLRCYASDGPSRREPRSARSNEGEAHHADA